VGINALLKNFRRDHTESKLLARTDRRLAAARSRRLTIPGINAD
jgi:hypothetical protein